MWLFTFLTHPNVILTSLLKVRIFSSFLFLIDTKIKLKYTSLGQHIFWLITTSCQFFLPNGCNLQAYEHFFELKMCEGLRTECISDEEIKLHRSYRIREFNNNNKKVLSITCTQRCARYCGDMFYTEFAF